VATFFFLILLPFLAPGLIAARKGARWGLIVLSVLFALPLLSILGVPLFRDPYTMTVWLIGTFLGAIILLLQTIAVRVSGPRTDPMRGNK
jgi:hypothetical protein